jgi:hypothetical protein
MANELSELSELSEDEIKIKVLSIFPETEYDVEYDNDSAIKWYYIKTKDGLNCLQLSSNNDFINIEGLEKCGKTGSDSLIKVYELAKLLPNIKYIKLSDKSFIKKCGFDIDLAFVKILTTGKSWYNSHGYFSKNYADEFDNNNKKINMDYNKFLDDVYKKMIDDFKIRNPGETYTDLEKVIDENNKSSLNLVYKSTKEEIQRIQSVAEKMKKQRIELFDRSMKIENSNNQTNTETLVDNVNVEQQPKISTKNFFLRVCDEIKNFKNCDDPNFVIFPSTDSNNILMNLKLEWFTKTLLDIKQSKILQYSNKNLIKIVDKTESYGGNYKNKYLKYKNKYLQLKNQNK